MIKKMSPLLPQKESKIPISLIEGIRLNNVFALVGSGLSIPLGFPSWEDLVSGIYSTIQDSLWKSDHTTKQWIKDNFQYYPDWTAELLKFQNDSIFYDKLLEVFNKRIKETTSVTHSILSLIPFKGYITTNYDTMIENYLATYLYTKPNVWDYKDLMNNPQLLNSNNTNVFKIHGCIEKDHTKLILTSSDYYQLLHDQRYVRFIDNLVTHNIIFSVGFSLRDRDFRTFIEERYNLYKSKCPPLYSIVSETETCPLEIDLYRQKYNIHVLPISPLNNFEELTSLLLSLYCLVYRVDSAKYGPQIIDLIQSKIGKFSKNGIFTNIVENPKIKKAKRLLSIFQEPVNLELFTTICTDSNIELTPAHYKAIALTENNKIYTLNKEQPEIEDITFISKWLAEYFQAIPLAENSRHLSIYHKKILREFSNTLFYLLSNKVGWEILIGNDMHSTKKLTRFNEFYRQEGKWAEWLDLVDIVENFSDKNSSQFLDLMKTKLWVFFWTRRYNEAKNLIEKYPLVDEQKGQYSYTSRLMYMNPINLRKLIAKLSRKKDLDYFDRSLLGRSYARISLTKIKQSEKTRLLKKAKEILILALDEAKKTSDMIEISVQSWYLSIVHAELLDIDTANHYLAEVRRIDESIMFRIPGIAWLKVAEYRLALSNNNITKNAKEEFREEAIKYMKELGMTNVEHYIDHEYFY